MTGTYTEIVEIIGPREAAVGERVDIEVKVKNLCSYAINITLTGTVNGLDLYFGDYYYTVPAGATQSFYDAFLMGGADVTLTVWSWYKIDGWPENPDDEKSVTIKTPEPVLEGTIWRKELEYNSYQTAIPVASVLQGSDYKVHIRGRNDTTSLQSLGAAWVVTDPDGLEVERHEDDWAFGKVGAGEDREFVSHSYFNFDKVGTYRIAMVLYMDSSNPVEVDSYTGVLCTVVPLALKIKSVVVPQGAIAGEVVTVKVVLFNDYSYSFEAIPTAAVNSVFLYFGNRWVVLSPSAEFEWEDTFIMPDHDALVHVEAWAKGIPYETDTKDVTVVLEEVPEPETLEIDITPAGTGYVTTVPASIEGKTEWHDGDTGTFPYGTEVEVTAHPYTGFGFDKWSDEIVGGVSHTNPAMVQSMTEHRAVKCHFDEEGEAGLETLEVDITPVGRGYVVTDPASEEGKTEWHNNETGKFPYGTTVKVTAIPVEGWVFEKWSDEIAGGVSFINPSYVQDMTEHRAVKCHFVEEEAVVPTFDEFKIDKIDGQDTPLAEVIQKGIGDTITVNYSFKYKLGASITTDIWASLYQITRTEKAQTKEEIVLTETVDWKTYNGEIAIIIGDVGEGAYGLICELPDHATEDKIENIIEVSGPPGMIESMMPLLALGLMAGIMIPMVKETT